MATARRPAPALPEEFTEYRKGQRVFGRKRVEMGKALLACYDAGKSIRDLTIETGRSYGFVYRLLAENGVEFRGRGGPRPQRRGRRRD